MRYLIFAGVAHYPKGGFYDLAATSNHSGVLTCELAAEIYAKIQQEDKTSPAWCHVYDTELGKVVWKMGANWCREQEAVSFTFIRPGDRDKPFTPPVGSDDD